MKKLWAIAALALAVTGIGMAVTAGPASASASGCSVWGPTVIGNIPIARGSYCVSISGSGTYVGGVASSYNAAGSVCNWNMTAEFFDASGRWYQTINGPIHWGCGWRGNDAIGVAAYKQRGTMCSTLKTNGTRLTSVCHNIY